MEFDKCIICGNQLYEMMEIYPHTKLKYLLVFKCISCDIILYCEVERIGENSPYTVTYTAQEIIKREYHTILGIEREICCEIVYKGIETDLFFISPSKFHQIFEGYKLHHSKLKLK